MLSFKKKGKSKPIAEILGGPKKGKMIYLNEKKKSKKYVSSSSESSSESESDSASDYSEEDSFSGSESGSLSEESEEDSEEESDGRSIKLKQGSFVQYPNPNTRDVPYIAGPAGVGKTTYTAQYTIGYKELFPDNPVFRFSRIEKDKAFDGIEITNVPINKDLIKDPIDIMKSETVKNGALVIFDDIDTIPDNKLRMAVYKLLMDILEIGRHKKIYVLVTSHLINGNERKNARTILNEATTITIFPKGGSTYQITYALKNYFGMSPSQIEKILKLDSRWVTLGKHYPQYVLYDKGAYLI